MLDALPRHHDDANDNKTTMKEKKEGEKGDKKGCNLLRKFDRSMLHIYCLISRSHWGSCPHLILHRMKVVNLLKLVNDGTES